MGGLAEEERRAARRPLESQHDPHERGLAAAVRPRHGHELTLVDAEVDVLEHMLAGAVAERDAFQLDR